jgi:phosphohistidine phosphatase
VRELFVVRHAIAHERNAARWPNDDARPLTDEGVQKFRQAARGLARLFTAPEESLTSPLIRARQTAAILEERAAFPPAIELEALRPDANLAALLSALSKRRAARIAVVGHEPDLSQLIGALLGGVAARPLLEMKKGAVAQLAFAQRIEAGGGHLIALLPPRVLRRLAGKG